jgi:hypothetical protein
LENREKCIIRSFVSLIYKILLEDEGDDVQGYVSCIGKLVNAYSLLFGNLETRGQLVIPRCDQEDHINLYYKETESEVLK